MFNGDELAAFVAQASWITVNDYEGKMLCERTGWSLETLSRKVRGLVVTLGGEGCEVWTDGAKTMVPPVAPAAVVDPTGCGDAWRGALLYGLEQGWPLEQCALTGQPCRGAEDCAARAAELPAGLRSPVKSLPPGEVAAATRRDRGQGLPCGALPPVSGIW